MKRSIKAALLSGLVFPGVGHFMLKKYWQGIALAGPAMLGLSFIISDVMQKTQAIAEKIKAGEIPLNIQAMAQLVTDSLNDSDLLRLNLAAWVIVICWVIATVDAFRIGAAQDRSATGHG